MSPHIPRVVLLGPTGSGKSLQAAQLADKYRLINGMCIIIMYIRGRKVSVNFR